jgi:glycine/D-amino acid oxidase-like deaminating enzyme
MITSREKHFDALVIGGGFYGCAVALFMMREMGLRRVGLVEREACLMQRASYRNQARVHNGYHYPRSFTTGFRSRISLPKFIENWSDAMYRDFSHVYAVARHDSRVTAGQFRHFCKEIGAKLEPLADSIRTIFEPRLIQDAFLVEEPAFDAKILCDLIQRELHQAGVEVMCGLEVQSIDHLASGDLLLCASVGNIQEKLQGRYVFNCTYSQISRVGDIPRYSNKLRHEIAELALVQVPGKFQSLGLTIVDGPFFSLMPFPSRGLHTLSHVRYTPHRSFLDITGEDPYEQLESYPKHSQFERMVRDAKRYVPALVDLRHVESLFEVKTVLVKNERDDGRPILLERHPRLARMYSIMGGKIDNIYEVLETLRLALPQEQVNTAYKNH